MSSAKYTQGPNTFTAVRPMALLLHVIAHESCKQDRSNEICNQQACHHDVQGFADPYPAAHEPCKAQLTSCNTPGSLALAFVSCDPAIPSYVLQNRCTENEGVMPVALVVAGM
jgi:hypothetical protein